MDDILAVKDLRVWFPVKKGVFSRTVGHVKAVDGVSFTLRRGETLGVVGESGSGKSTLARVVAGLQKPTSGKLQIGGRVGMVFQDPLGSLNPRMTVAASLVEIPGAGDPRRLLEMVGLDESALDKYPHEFSGGQRQRICIAQAIAARPELLICDEAVSALDIQIRAQILDLLKSLKERLGLSLMFITHDLGVVQHVAERLIVMYHGVIAEEGDCRRILSAPQSDYTRNLIAAVPRIAVQNV